MAGTPIGRILLMPKGNYSGTAVYNGLDWVRYNGSAWVCTTDNTTGIAPAIGVPEWQVLAQDGTVSGTVDWSNVNFKPFDTVGSGLDVDVSNVLKLDMTMLTGSNISYDNSGSGAASSDVQGAIDELFRGGGGGGLLPYFFIDSEAGSTVTVNVPDGSTITPTPAGSGHWECSVPMYGTYTIHSVLAGQGDATVSVNVDEVKQYHITDNHFDFTINVTAPNGSTIRITGGDETYTGTGTGSSQAFAVHAPSTTYTIAVTMDGNTKSDTVTSAATTGQSDSVTIDFGTINVTVDPDFVTAGSTITCALSPYNTITKTAASSLTFRVPSTGSWTISGTIGSDTYYTSPNPVVVNNLNTPVSADLETMPNGATVLPTDDIETWLKCAGIRDKSYTTLAEVLADTDTLVALCADSNACDYMTRSTTWASGVTTDADAMNIVGKYDYCANALLSDATWASAILASSYVDYVVEVKCPTMTSNNMPSGYQVIPESVLGSSYDGFKAFDGNNSTQWVSDSSHSIPVGSTNTGYIIFKFPSPVVITNAAITSNTNSPTQAYTISGSNDNSTYTPITTGGALSQTALVTFANTVAYEYYKIELTQKNADSSAIEVPRLLELQYYGRTEKNYTGTVIHSAVEDVTYYVSGGSNVPFCTIASGDTDTVSSSIISSLKGQTVTIGSSVAKDPTNLANDYTKSVRITPNITEIYLMPDTASYWWGYRSNDLEEISTANGWTYQNYAPISPTYNKNDVLVSATSNTLCGISAPVGKNGIGYSINQGTTVGTYGNYGILGSFSVKQAESGYGTAVVPVTSNSLAKYNVNVATGDYLTAESSLVQAQKVYALWYE